LDTIKNEVKKRRLLQVFPTNSRWLKVSV
jgi:hypothetical protein